MVHYEVVENVIIIVGIKQQYNYIYSTYCKNNNYCFS